MRALRAHQGMGADADLWSSGVSREYRRLLMVDAVGRSAERAGRGETPTSKAVRQGISNPQAEPERDNEGEIPFGKLLRCRVRYFTDGAVIGSRSFVEEAFRKSRERFGVRRKTGARRLKGETQLASKLLWSVRDLRKGVV